MLPRKAVRSFILGHSVKYEIRTFDENVCRQVWPTLGSGVVQSLYAHSPASYSLKDMFVCGTQRSVQIDPTKHRGYYSVPSALTPDELHSAHRVYLMFRKQTLFDYA
jgi:hypothetical protein